MTKNTLLFLISLLLSFYLPLRGIGSVSAQTISPIQNICNFNPAGAVTGNVTLANNCVIYEDVNGAANGNIILSGNSVTLYRTMVWYPGYEIQLNNATIYVNSNAEIVQAKICYKDADQDLVPGVKDLTVDPATGGRLEPLTSLKQLDTVVSNSSGVCPDTYTLRESFTSLAYVDPDDASQADKNISFSEDSELLGMGFQIDGVTDALAAAGDVIVGGSPQKNLIITSTGKLGIGLTAGATPANELYVTGTGSFTSTLTASNGFTLSAGTLSLPTGAITTTMILDGTIATGDIATDTILAGNIAAGAVGTSEIADGTVATGDIATDTIAAVDIATGAVGTLEIADGAIAATDIAANAVGASEITDNSVGDLELFNGGTWNITSALNITGDSIGFGTAAPRTGYKLDARGSIVTSDGVDQGFISFRQDRDDVSIYEDADYKIHFNAPTGFYFDFDNNNNGGNLNITDYGASALYVADGGSVGIGITTPLSHLHIHDGTDTTVRIGEEDGTMSLSSVNLGTTSYTNWAANASYEGGAWTRTSTTHDHWTMGFGVNNSNTGFFEINHANLGTGTPTWTKTMIMGANGNVAFGATVPHATGKLHVVGAAYLTTGTAWTSTSDYRFKDIEDHISDSSLEKIMKLDPISYRWNDLHNQKYNSTKEKLNYGFVAQEVEKVFPSLVNTDPDGYKMYNPTGFEAILTGSIQELNTKISTLEDKLSKQQSQIDLLTQRLNDLENKDKTSSK